MITTDPEPSAATAPSGLGAEDVLLFKVCVAAIWSDGAMAAAERDHLSHLMDRVAATEDQRHELRRIALHDVSRSAVLGEAGGLEADAARRLYDRCLAVLASDRRLRRGELAFINRLRRRCRVSAVAHQRALWRLAPAGRLLRLAALAILAVIAAALWLERAPETRPPAELGTRRQILLPRPPDAAPMMDAETLYAAIRHSVVKINVLIDGAPVGHGSGSILGVDRDGQLYVLTNRHVVYHELAELRTLGFEIELGNGIQLPAVLDFYSRVHDLAVVLAPGVGGWGPPAPLRSCADLRVGEPVWAVGSPIGLDHSFTSGVVSAIRGNMVQTDATVHSGSSGGPLFDTRGRVCGVITMTHTEKDFSFALCAESVLEMLAERSAPK
jgi:hypothetical protein